MQSTDRLPTNDATMGFWRLLELMMFELFEDVVEVTARLMKLMSCIGFAGYVAWKSNFIVPESYGDLAVPAVMALFVAALLLVAGAMINQRVQEQRR